MTLSNLYDELNYVDKSRERRQLVANKILDNPTLVGPLLEVLFLVNDPTSCRAAWVLEYACRENIDILLPNMDSFIEGIPKVTLDSAVRPVAKIMECLAEAYYHNENKKAKDVLKQKHIDIIISVAFDYLINHEKIAPKAYSMTTLYLFGKTVDWVHPELKILIERDYHKQTAGFKARARHILKQLTKG